MQVVRRQGSQDEAIALLQQWLDIMDESGLSITAGMLDTITNIMLTLAMQPFRTLRLQPVATSIPRPSQWWC